MGPARRAAVAMVTLVLVAAGCDETQAPPSAGPGTPVTSPSEADTLVIGLVATLSGADSWRGEDAFEGADLAVGELNRTAADGGRGFELVSLDDEGDPDLAAGLVQGLADDERTVGVVYAGPPEGIIESEPALARAGIPAVVCYGDLHGARLLRPHIFQTSPSFLWEAPRIAAYLLDDRGYARIGVLVEDSLSGDTAEAALRSAVGQLGGRGTTPVRYRAGDSLARGLRRLRARRVEAIVFQGSPDLFQRALEVLDGWGAGYRSTRAARRGGPGPRGRRGPWRPQVAAFDLGMAPGLDRLRPGTLVADSYSRGSHLLDVPSLAAFRESFESWWGAKPVGWERRAYEAAHMVAWAARRGRGDVARALEGLSGRRFGGVDIDLSPDDHTSVAESTVGLWVVPRDGIRTHGHPPEELPWLPLARTFTGRGAGGGVLAEDRRHLFRDPPTKGGPSPRYTLMRPAVATSAEDPVH